MKFRKLGQTGLDISVIGQGTMTRGFQNTQAEGFEQMDYALERDINFFDTAEMYAIRRALTPLVQQRTLLGTGSQRGKIVKKSFLHQRLPGLV